MPGDMLEFNDDQLPPGLMRLQPRAVVNASPLRTNDIPRPSMIAS